MGKILDEILGSIAKVEGKSDNTCLLSELDAFKDVSEWASTSIPELNHLLKTPGFPTRMVIEITGREQSGKTTAAWHYASGVQKMAENAVVIILSTERRNYAGYPKKIGVKEEQVIIEKPKTLEKIFERMNYWMSKLRDKYGYDFPIVFIVDSIGATPSKAEDAADADDNFMGIAARVLKKNLRKNVWKFDENNVTFFVINQVYELMNTAPGQKKTKSYGGSGLRLASAIRIEVTDIGKITLYPKDKVNRKKVGQYTKLELLKCDFSPPFRDVVVPLLYGVGFVPSIDGLKMCEEFGILEKYKFGYIAKFNPEYKWKNETEYYELCIKSSKFRKTLIALMDIHIKKKIFKSRIKKVNE